MKTLTELTMRRSGLRTACLVSFMLALLSHVQVAQSQSAASPALATMSDKQLLKKADADQAAGRLEDAREAIILALAKKKNKPNKKYDPLLASINGTLADRETAKGEIACKNMNLVACEQHIQAAKKFASTSKAAEVEADFERLLGEIRQKRESASRSADSGKPDEALSDLNSLQRFGAHLPNLSKDIERVTRLVIERRLQEGKKAVETQRWGDASLHFQRVLELEKVSASAKKGLETIERGRKGYASYEEAKASLTAESFRNALKAINVAIEFYPEAKEFQKTLEQITRLWAAHLVRELPSLASSPDDFKRTCKAFLNIEQVRELDPVNAEVSRYSKAATENFGANSLQRASELASIVDYSRIASALVTKLNAQRLLPPGTVRLEELKDIASTFNRKRTSQLVFSVQDLSGGASTKFLQAVRDLSRSTLDNLGLPDLKVRSLDDYLKSPNEDPQFQDLRPDGKSSTVLLKLDITKYETERKPSENPVQKKSQYISGTEMVRNPEFYKVLEELNQIRSALDNPKRKKDKPTPEGWTQHTYQQKQLELNKIEPSIARDKITDYSYQEIPYKQHTTVEVNV